MNTDQATSRVLEAVSLYLDDDTIDFEARRQLATIISTLFDIDSL